MDHPLVSVIVPTYNRERYLRGALDSVFHQDYRPLEVIVVDDGSTDGTAGVACSFADVRHVYQSNQGVAAARNTGVAASRGSFLAFLDSDDLWTANKLAVQMSFHFQNPQVGWTVAHMRTLLEPGCPTPAWLRPELLHQEAPARLPSALVVRREAFERIGGFDCTYRMGDDVDWFFRARDSGIPTAVLPEVLLLRRVHDANLSQQVQLNNQNLLKIVKASLDRARRRPSDPS